MSSSGLIDLSMQIASAIVTDRRSRRRVMVASILIAAGQCIIGTLLLPAAITESPWFLLLFWGFCLLCVVIAAGLALLDTLKLRHQFTSELIRLRSELQGNPDAVDKAGRDADHHNKRSSD